MKLFGVGEKAISLQNFSNFVLLTHHMPLSFWFDVKFDDGEYDIWPEGVIGHQIDEQGNLRYHRMTEY